MNEQHTVETMPAATLTDDELSLVVGGGEDPIKPIGGIGDNIESGKATPILMLLGDAIDKDSRWVTYRKIDTEYAAVVRAAGGSVDVVQLPDVGIKGNSHMLMMDKNNAEIANVIQGWLVRKGLVD